MEITILDERPNPLLKRREYRFEVAHATAATPSRDAVRGEISKLVKAPKDRVIIERMGAQYGTATTRGDALVYDSADAAKSITRDHILVRNGLKEKAAKGPAAPSSEPAAAPAAEPAKPEAPAAAPAPAEAPAPKPEPKAEPHKSEHKPESKGEPKPDHKPEPHKSEHKPKAAKGDKDAPSTPEA